MYDYLENVKNDVREAIEYNYSKEDLRNPDIEEKIYDDLWVNDSVTGNASGSYTCNAYQAEEYLCHNWDLLVEALETFGDDVGNAIKSGAEYCDVTIRCYLLSQAISEVLEELNED